METRNTLQCEDIVSTSREILEQFIRERIRNNEPNRRFCIAKTRNIPVITAGQLNRKICGII